MIVEAHNGAALAWGRPRAMTTRMISCAEGCSARRRRQQVANGNGEEGPDPWEGQINCSLGPAARAEVSRRTEPSFLAYLSVGSDDDRSGSAIKTSRAA